MSHTRRSFLMSLAAITSPAWFCPVAFGQEIGERLTHPVFRVARTEPTAPAHPLDQALKMAEDGLTHIRTNVKDYTATLCKREKVGDVVGDYEYMFVKVRNEKTVNGQVTIPFSVYLSFLKPAEVKGREVIYVRGKNDNKMVAHEGGVKGRFLPTVWLDPTGMLAMRGNRYPIYELGIENLVVQLIQRGGKDRQHPDLQVEFRKGATINGRVCTVIQILHPEYRPGMDFHTAQVFIDDELNMPIRYVAHDWPSAGRAEGDVIEEYTYLNVQVNVGLQDVDFEPTNPNYNF